MAVMGEVVKIDIADIQIVRPELLKKGDVLMFFVPSPMDREAINRAREVLYVSGIPDHIAIVFVCGVDEMKVIGGARNVADWLPGMENLGDRR